MTQFKALGLSDAITSSLSSMGYEKPTPIQQITIPQILGSNQDLKAFAQTGTGKTAAFSLPILEAIDTDRKHTQALILSPTRELAIQIATVHLLFNLGATVLLFPVERIRNVPTRLAEWLSNVAARSRLAAVVYVVGLFYVLPGALVMLTR